MNPLSKIDAWALSYTARWEWFLLIDNHPDCTLTEVGSCHYVSRRLLQRTHRQNVQEQRIHYAKDQSRG